MDKIEIEVCFSPLLFDARAIREGFIAVVCDIFRATTSFCAAFHNGVNSIIPLQDMEEARRLKMEQGVLIAGERDGEKPDFADFGNDPVEFTPQKVSGQDIYYATTNGTRMLLQAAKHADKTIIGSFLNIDKVAEYLVASRQHVVICCSGWKGRFSFEDAFFAGTLSEKLLEYDIFATNCDSVYTSLQLWKSGKSHPAKYIAQQSSHYQRLVGLGKGNIIGQAFQMNSCPVLPMMDSDRLVLAVD